MNSLNSGRRARVLRDVSTASHPLQTLEPRARAAEPGLVDEAESGYAAGFDQGYQDGLAAAGAAVAAEAEGLRLRLNRALSALTAAAAELGQRQALALATVEDAVAEAAFALATAVVGRELELSAAPGTDAVARALALTPPDVVAVAHLHPDDLAAVDPDGLAPGRSLTLVADPTVEPGGCVMVAGDCRIDAQLGPALERARAALTTGGAHS